MNYESITNPFPGLRPFEMDENHLFFGRDGQSNALIDRLRRHRFIAVHGTSGCGKSSLVRAGLLPALVGGLMTQAGSNWRLALFRPGSNPIRNLAQALSDPYVCGTSTDDYSVPPTLIEATLRRSGLGLIEVVRAANLPPHDNVLVVVDQFEELFRFQRDQPRREPHVEDEAAAFVRLLLEAAKQNDVPLFVVATMRSDFIGDCAQFQDLPEAFNAGQYLVPRMSRDERRDAIVGPIAVGGGKISNRLVSRLLNDVGDSPDRLPILQHALMRSWDLWMRDRSLGEPIDLRHYEAIGTMANALSFQADEAFEELPDVRAHSVAEKTFKCLTEKSPDNREARHPTTVGEICAIVEAAESEVITVIEVFRVPSRSLLMPPATVPLNANSLIDISHESLIREWSRLRHWVDEEARSAQIYRRIADTAKLYYEESAGLWHNPDLMLAVNWREQTRPNAAWARRYYPDFDLAMSFLNASVRANEEELMRLERARSRKLAVSRAAATALALMFLVSSVLSVYSFRLRTEADIQRGIAEEQRRLADEQRLEALKLKSEVEQQRDMAERKSEMETMKRHEAETRSPKSRSKRRLAK